jgi:hypothetical protein
LNFRDVILSSRAVAQWRPVIGHFAGIPAKLYDGYLIPAAWPISFAAGESLSGPR